MKDYRAELPVRSDMIWDLLIRLSGVALFVPARGRLFHG